MIFLVAVWKTHVYIFQHFSFSFFFPFLLVYGTMVRRKRRMNGQHQNQHQPKPKRRTEPTRETGEATAIANITPYYTIQYTPESTATYSIGISTQKLQ